MPLRPDRTIAELEELRELTGDADGAQRVAWTETWERARDWLRGKLAASGAEEEIDAAGNQWFTVRGASDRTLVIGGHLDSVIRHEFLRERRAYSAQPSNRMDAPAR